MDGEGIVWLIAIGWVILSWIMKAIRGAVGQPGTRADGPIEQPDERPDAHDLREERARRRMERARRRLNKPTTPSPREGALEDFRRELERVMGVHVEDEHGPAGRRSTVSLESDEEVEERESLEEEPEVVSMETAGDRGMRVVVDHDSQAEELVRRRIAVAEAHSKPHSRADHRRFDARIREAESALAQPAAPKQPHSLRQAFIWSEVLGKPVSERDR